MNSLTARFHAPLALALLLMAASHLPAQNLLNYPLVGAITDNSCIIAVWMDSKATFSIQYNTDPGLGGAANTVNGTLDSTTQVALTGLLPNTRYYYRINNSGGNAMTAIRSFKTFPAHGVDAPATILFGSCQQSQNTSVGRTFDVADTLGGDVFVQIGDWAYPDHRIAGYPTAPGTIEASYRLRLDTNYSFSKHILSKMGIAYVWDDHDFSGNDADGSIDPALKQQLLDAYNQHIPHYPLPNAQSGIWQSFMIGNVEVFMIDDRTQRNPVDSALKNGAFNPPPGHSMLAGYPVNGVDQRTWLLKAIRESKARWKILASQVFFNPANAPFINLALIAGRPDLAAEFADKWVGYPADIDSMRHLFQEGFGRNFLIICGDAHTNMYDNGTHSIVSEFMAGDLDQENSNLYSTLKGYGFDVWTAGQTDSSSTVGRIRIETSPKHRLIVDSFDTNGRRVLSYEMLDNSGASAPEERASAWKIGAASTLEGGRTLRIPMENAPGGTGRITVYNVGGASIADMQISPAGTQALNVALPPSLPSGTYLGRITIGPATREFKFELTR